MTQHLCLYDSFSFDTFKSKKWTPCQAETYSSCNTHLMAMPCLKVLKVRGRQMAKLKATVTVTNIIDGKLKIIETSKFENTQSYNNKSVGEGIKYFSVIIFHALAVTNGYKQLRVYLEKSSTLLNKQKQYKTETCLFKMKLYLTK